MNNLDKILDAAYKTEGIFVIKYFGDKALYSVSFNSRYHDIKIKQVGHRLDFCLKAVLDKLPERFR